VEHGVHLKFNAAYTSSSSINQHLHLRIDIYCVGWGIKLYSLTHSIRMIV